MNETRPGVKNVLIFRARRRRRRYSLREEAGNLSDVDNSISSLPSNFVLLIYDVQIGKKGEIVE